MSIDVTTQVEIRVTRERVVAYAMDPENATSWYENIKSVKWQTPKPLTVGSRFEFVAHFLGRRLAYTYEVTQLVPGTRYVMATAQGPFPMETTYEWEDTTAGGTLMTLRNRGEPAGFSKLTGRMMAGAMRRANTKDLEHLKTILESRQAGSPPDPA
jgi:Polyketide cyclase / dehydrase and lipid transport